MTTEEGHAFCARKAGKVQEHMNALQKVGGLGHAWEAQESAQSAALPQSVLAGHAYMSRGVCVVGCACRTPRFIVGDAKW